MRMATAQGPRVLVAELIAGEIARLLDAGNVNDERAGGGATLEGIDFADCRGIKRVGTEAVDGFRRKDDQAAGAENLSGLLDVRIGDHGDELIVAEEKRRSQRANLRPASPRVAAFVCERVGGNENSQGRNDLLRDHFWRGVCAGDDAVAGADAAPESRRIAKLNKRPSCL